MPAAPTPIGKLKQLLVEGRDEEEFFNALLRHLTIDAIEVRNYEGKGNLRRFLNVFERAPGFDEVQSIGIVRDADDSATSAFQSVQDSLRSVNLPVPTEASVPADESPRVDVFIMPGNSEEGALEDLCLGALEGEPAMQCVSDYMQCVQQHLSKVPRNISKARIHAFLASREDPELRLGQAAHRGYFPWGDSAFEQVIKFVESV